MFTLRRLNATQQSLWQHRWTVAPLLIHIYKMFALRRLNATQQSLWQHRWTVAPLLIHIYKIFALRRLNTTQQSLWQHRWTVAPLLIHIYKIFTLRRLNATQQSLWQHRWTVAPLLIHIYKILALRRLNTTQQSLWQHRWTVAPLLIHIYKMFALRRLNATQQSLWQHRWTVAPLLIQEGETREHSLVPCPTTARGGGAKGAHLVHWIAPALAFGRIAVGDGVDDALSLFVSDLLVVIFDNVAEMVATAVSETAPTEAGNPFIHLISQLQRRDAFVADMRGDENFSPDTHSLPSPPSPTHPPLSSCLPWRERDLVPADKTTFPV